jgi:MerR family transcriptional regulator, copper efflux regulator
VSKIPIACSLTTDDAKVRIDEWSALLKTHGVTVERTSSSARLRLRDGAEAILVAIDLAQREKECCAFFEFRLVILANAVWLEVEVPGDADVTLDDLSLMTTP